MVKIKFADILFIEALEKYVRITTIAERIVTLLSMSQLESTLPTRNFVRIHRSYIVNMDKIDSIEGNLVQIGKEKLSISKGQRELFLEKIKGINF